MRRKIVAGNWKMNKTHDEAKEMFMHLNTWVRTRKPSSKVIIAPTAIFLGEMKQMFYDSPVILASQDVSSEEIGAYTGEISAIQLKSINIEYCIVGHSERRKHHEDDDRIVSQKVGLLFKNKARPIVCVGESLEQRQNEMHFDLVKKQVLSAMEGQNEEDLEKLIIAYEPIWAIGTGETASPLQAQEMHRFIRDCIAKEYSAEMSDKIRIIYGGSVDVGNSRDLFDQPDVDGGLVGGASLKFDDFKLIINACG